MAAGWLFGSGAAVYPDAGRLGALPGLAGRSSPITTDLVYRPGEQDGPVIVPLGPFDSNSLPHGEPLIQLAGDFGPGFDDAKQAGLEVLRHPLTGLVFPPAMGYQLAERLAPQDTQRVTEEAARFVEGWMRKAWEGVQENWMGSPEERAQREEEWRQWAAEFRDNLIRDIQQAWKEVQEQPTTPPPEPSLAKVFIDEVVYGAFRMVASAVRTVFEMGALAFDVQQFYQFAGRVALHALTGRGSVEEPKWQSDLLKGFVATASDQQNAYTANAVLDTLTLGFREKIAAFREGMATGNWERYQDSCGPDLLMVLGGLGGKAPVRGAAGGAMEAGPRVLGREGIAGRAKPVAPEPTPVRPVAPRPGAAAPKTPEVAPKAPAPGEPVSPTRPNAPQPGSAKPAPPAESPSAKHSVPPESPGVQGGANRWTPKTAIGPEEAQAREMARVLQREMERELEKIPDVQLGALTDWLQERNKLRRRRGGIPSVSDSITRDTLAREIGKLAREGKLQESDPGKILRAGIKDRLNENPAGERGQGEIDSELNRLGNRLSELDEELRNTRREIKNHREQREGKNPAQSSSPPMFP